MQRAQDKAWRTLSDDFHTRHKPAGGGWIGRSVPRSEDYALLTGRGRFVDDIGMPGCLHLEFLRSNHARGSIGHMAVGAAQSAAGVVGVFTGADVALEGVPQVNRLTAQIHVPPFHALARDCVLAVGQPIAAVVAQTAAQARDAAALIELEIDSQGADVLEREAVAHRWTAGNVDQAFDSADHVVEVEIEHARLAPTALEPRAALARWDAEGQLLTIWLSTQTPHRAKEDLSRLLQLQQNQVRVIAPDVGGAFGGKSSIYPEEIVVAWAALRLGQPVRWCASRSDELMAATHGRGARTRAELAISDTGQCLGLRARLRFPLGYWMPYSGAVPARNAGRILPGPYRIGAVDIEVSGHLSNTTAVGIYRGAGRPEAAMLLERLMDGAARRIGMDPLELRGNNLIAASQMPHRTPTGETVDSGDYPALLGRARKLASYDQLLVEREQRRVAGEICGVGIGLYIEPCGQGWESASLSLDREGRIIAAAGTTSQGQGRVTAARQIICDALDVSPELVEVRVGDTADTPLGIGALASRGTAIGGSALLKAATLFREKARAVAAAMTQVPIADVKSGPGGFAVRCSRRRLVSWYDVAQFLAQDGDPANGAQRDLATEVIYEAQGEAWSSGCCIASVCIDQETGTPRVEQISWVDDAGVVVNPMLVEGQLVGGMAQGVGEALMERVVYDAEGQLITGSLMDYGLPRASDIPKLVVDKMVTPSPANMLGAKGVGEAGCIGVPAAIVNAVVDALSPFGINHIDMPLTSEKIWRALRGASQASMRA